MVFVRRIRRQWWLLGEEPTRDSFTLVQVEKAGRLVLKNIIATKLVVTVKVDDIGMIRVRDNTIGILTVFFEFRKPAPCVFRIPQNLVSVSRNLVSVDSRNGSKFRQICLLSANPFKAQKKTQGIIFYLWATVWLPYAKYRP